jgi:hypothetical protein
MIQHECDNCGMTFTRKSGLIYHIEKNVCNEKEYKCRYCVKTFSSESSWYRHMRSSCKSKPTDEDLLQDESQSNIFDQIDKQAIYEKLLDMQNRIDHLEAENGQLKQEMKTTQSGNNITNNTNSHNTINNVNNGTINYYLVGYGKEDYNAIDRTTLLKSIGTGFNSTFNLIDTVHFNPEYPEFHNVYISSMKNKYAMMYDGTDWTLVMKDDLIDKMYDDKRNYIEENLDEFIDSLTKSQINALQRWMNVNDDYPYISKIKNNIKLLLYNKRNMVMNPKHKVIDMESYLKKSHNLDDISNIKVIHSHKSNNTHTKKLVCNTDNHIETSDGLSSIIENKVKKTAERRGTKRKILIK